MSGIGGIGGMGMSGVDLSAWAGMGGVSNVFGTTLAPMVTQPQAAQVSSVGMGTNLQALVQTLQQFSQAEILLALFLAFNTRRCDQHHDHHSAFNQQSSVPGNVDVASMVTSVSSQTAMSINVTG